MGWTVAIKLVCQSRGRPQSGTYLSAEWWATTCPQAHRGFRPGGESHLWTCPGGQAPLTPICILVGSSTAIWIRLDINDIHKWADRRPFVWFYLRTPLVSGPVWLDHVNAPFVSYLTCAKKLSALRLAFNGAKCGPVALLMKGEWQVVNFHSVK